MNQSSTSGTVLVIDDEPAICWCLEQLFTEDGLNVVTASAAEAGLKLATEYQPCLIILDVRLPGMDGLTALPMLSKASPSSPIVVVTAFGDLQTAVQAVQQGAADYLTKPFGTEQVRKICRSVMRPQAQVNSDTDGPLKTPALLVGRSAAMQEVYRKIAMVADSDLSVLITGETGTGKELIAAAIHANSQRRHAPYLPIAPVALNPALIESELFGHVRGAFTGANENRPGLFALAEGGTILLDEIGDLSLAVQVKLLRVLEQRQFTPVGDVRPRDCNIRILAATHRDLKTSISNENFREDLYYRLAAVEIHAPPLRERLDDLEMLVQYFLASAGHTAPHAPVDPHVIEELQRRAWPGNIRELRNVIEHASVMSRGRTLAVEHLPPSQKSLVSLTSPSTSSSDDVSESLLSQIVAQWAMQATEQSTSGDGDLMNRFLAAVEPAMLEVVLNRTGGNRAAAAQWLGIHRGTLRERLRRYGLDP